MKLYLLAILGLPISSGAQAPYIESLCPDAAAPVQAVEGYLTAMQQHRFDDAFDFVGPGMTDGRSRADWSGMQKFFYERGEVDIYAISPRPALATAEDPECGTQALVPNMLSSRDKLNVNGIVEFELYTVVLDDQQWRVEQQKTLYDNGEINKWFPDVEIVEVSVAD